jgi:linoleoyl-CoA desaturase
MTPTEHLPVISAYPVQRVAEITRKLKFDKDDRFQIELRRRVDEFCRRTGRRQRDCPQMYVKTAILLTSLVTSYALLVFVAQTWWQALPLAIWLGLTTAGIGFNIQHDGGHRAYSNHRWVNQLMAMSLDLIGGSSYLWHWKHAVLHHTYANITDHDTDIDWGGLGRVTPHQKRCKLHRWQHFYLWPFYGLISIKWHLHDDFQELITSRIKAHRIPRPKGWNLAILLAGKGVFFIVAFVVPMMFHRWWVALTFYAVTEFVLGMSMSIVFLLAHMVEPAAFPLPQADTGRIAKPWAIHQVETTVDFSRNSRVAAWLFGGLNFQIEHHLFPLISHTNYPAISKIVEATCREFGVEFREHKSFLAGVVSHFRWLRRMGKAPTETDLVPDSVPFLQQAS